MEFTGSAVHRGGLASRALLGLSLFGAEVTVATRLGSTLLLTAADLANLAVGLDWDLNLELNGALGLVAVAMLNRRVAVKVDVNIEEALVRAAVVGATSATVADRATGIYLNIKLNGE